MQYFFQLISEIILNFFRYKTKLTIFARIKYFYMGFSKRIKFLCKEQGLHLQDLANRLGISPTSLSQAINQPYPQLQTLERIARALDVEIVDLFAPSERGAHKCPHCGKPIEIRLEVK